MMVLAHQVISATFPEVQKLIGQEKSWKIEKLFA
jgi:hypothetical protein